MNSSGITKTCAAKPQPYRANALYLAVRSGFPLSGHPTRTELRLSGGQVMIDGEESRVQSLSSMRYSRFVSKSTAFGNNRLLL